MSHILCLTSHHNTSTVVSVTAGTQRSGVNALGHTAGLECGRLPALRSAVTPTLCLHYRRAVPGPKSDKTLLDSGPCPRSGHLRADGPKSAE